MKGDGRKKEKSNLSVKLPLDTLRSDKSEDETGEMGLVCEGG